MALLDFFCKKVGEAMFLKKKQKTIFSVDFGSPKNSILVMHPIRLYCNEIPKFDHFFRVPKVRFPKIQNHCPLIRRAAGFKSKK